MAWFPLLFEFPSSSPAKRPRNAWEKKCHGMMFPGCEKYHMFFLDSTAVAIWIYFFIAYGGSCPVNEYVLRCANPMYIYIYIYTCNYVYIYIHKIICIRMYRHGKVMKSKSSSNVEWECTQALRDAESKKNRRWETGLSYKHISL